METPVLNSYITIIKRLVQKNGPDPEEYSLLDQLMAELGKLKEEKQLVKEDILFLQRVFGEAMTSGKTLQGHVCVKPHGYPGDYEIIDKIYTKHISDENHLQKWDYYFHNQPATKAVRNRKDYLIEVLESKPQDIEVLNLASGPCRDLVEFFLKNPVSKIRFDCVEMDCNAISYACELFSSQDISLSNVNFIPKNILRFHNDRKYDLIWSSGLFDYFNDCTFINLLARFLGNLKDEGEMIIGNFHCSNPSRHYMEFGEWYLNHRNEDQMIKLALMSGIPEKMIRIKYEPEGVNLFMHISTRNEGIQ